MVKKKVCIVICCFMLIFAGCRSENQDTVQEVIPGIDMSVENSLDLRKIYIKRAGHILTPTTDFLPRTYDMETEIIEEVKRI